MILCLHNVPTKIFEVLTYQGVIDLSEVSDQEQPLVGDYYSPLSDNEGKENLNLKALIEKYCKKCGALIKLKNMKTKMKDLDRAP